MDIATTPAYRTISNHEIAEVRRKTANDQNALFSLCHYQPGDMIADFSAGTIAAEPTYLTVQVGHGKHITLQPDFLQYINHGCDPNVFFDTTAMQLVALKEIKPGTELLFFYPSCGSPACLGQIQGAAFLSHDAINHYRFTDFIRRELSAKAAKTKVA